jgi:hypothetical protein
LIDRLPEPLKEEIDFEADGWVDFQVLAWPSKMVCFPVCVI